MTDIDFFFFIFFLFMLGDLYSVIIYVVTQRTGMLEVL